MIAEPAEVERGVVVWSNARDLFRVFRPQVWVVLQDLVLDAEWRNGRLMASSSARLVADHLHIDPGTAAAALWTLRDRGVAELCQTSGAAGRFGLASYTLRFATGFGDRWPHLGPHTDKPHTDRPRHGTSRMRTSRMRTSHTQRRPARSWRASNLRSVRLDRLAVGRSRPGTDRRGLSISGPGRRERRELACPEGWQVSVAICFGVGWCRVLTVTALTDAEYRVVVGGVGDRRVLHGCR